MIRNFCFGVVLAFAFYFIYTVISGLVEQKKHRHLPARLDDIEYVVCIDFIDRAKWISTPKYD